MKPSSTHRRIYVIGSDAGGIRNLPKHLQKLVLKADSLAGPERLLESFKEWWEKNSPKKSLPELFSSNKVDLLINWLKEQNGTSVLISSGDPLWFGIGRKLLESFTSKELQFHPAPSSLQLAFSRIGIPWQNASWISLHGRDPSPLSALLQKRPSSLVILTDPDEGGVEEVRKILKSSGLEKSYAFWIFEQLGHPKERIRRLFPFDELFNDIHPLNLVLLQEDATDETNPQMLPLFGVDDGVFLQHKDRPGLMTKKEIRVQLLAELELPKEGVLWDLCAGVGSIGLEALRLNPSLKLLLVERRGGGAAIIKQNALRLGVQPDAVVESDVLTLLEKNILPENLSCPNRVLIGGGGIKRNYLIKEILGRISPNGVVVIPLATIEAIKETKDILVSYGCEISISQHQSWRGIPLSSGIRLSPMNPVFIIKGRIGRT